MLYFFLLHFLVICHFRAGKPRPKPRLFSSTVILLSALLHTCAIARAGWAREILAGTLPDLYHVIGSFTICICLQLPSPAPTKTERMKKAFNKISTLGTLSKSTRWAKHLRHLKQDVLVIVRLERIGKIRGSPVEKYVILFKFLKV